MRTETLVKAHRCPARGRIAVKTGEDRRKASLRREPSEPDDAIRPGEGNAGVKCRVAR